MNRSVRHRIFETRLKAKVQERRNKAKPQKTGDSTMFAVVMAQLLSETQAAPACRDTPPIRIDLKADLPAKVIALLPGPMAERGQLFQGGDVVSVPRLPLYRFIDAEQKGCRLSVRYEHGGRGYGTVVAQLEYGGTGWLIVNSNPKK